MTNLKWGGVHPPLLFYSWALYTRQPDQSFSPREAADQVPTSTLLSGILRAGFAQHAQVVSALLAIAFLAALIGIAAAYPHASPARRAVQQDIGGSNGHFL